VSAACTDPLQAGETQRERAILQFAASLTRLDRPAAAEDLRPLREAGLDDDAIRDLVQIVGYFAFVNRHVEGLGIELEADHPGRRWGELMRRRTTREM
jgi:alkylhydroperoxidase family enzyme